MSEPSDLQRFLAAQDDRSTYAHALQELRDGHKRSHWMWFVFPQLAGLGTSEMAQRYAIASVDEAIAYLAHPELGHRLRECAEAVDALPGSDATSIFGSVDALKLRSSVTLFAQAAQAAVVGREPAAAQNAGIDVFSRILDHYFQGQPDPETLRRLGR